MVKHMQKKLWGYHLLMVMGFAGNVAHGTQGADVERPLQLFQAPPHIVAAVAMARIPGDPRGRTYFLEAVDTGNVAMVRLFVENCPNLDHNMTDKDGNTDTMLAIKGGGQDDFGENYQTIFDLIAQQENRDWNLQNHRGQTALLLAVGWGRLRILRALLQRPEVDPNLPKLDRTTPLIAALGNTLVPKEVKVTMATMLIAHPRGDVNQRGGDNRLPLQIAFEAGLAAQLVNPICRRSLMDYDMAVRRNTRELLQNVVLSLPTLDGERLPLDRANGIADGLLQLEFGPNLVDGIDGILNDHHGELDVAQAIGPNVPRALLNLVGIFGDPRVNVENYETCGLGQLVNAVRRKIDYLRNRLGMALPDTTGSMLQAIDYNTQLYNDFLSPQDDGSRQARLSLLGSALQYVPLQ
ncbi:MAG: ankyrin repeat domain-containing protein [Puniceicoccales bacterium]|jgi:hypothetical protein|nr:ankyrin repeat domain-containing protein [Puniceicoccales bacterium]